MNHTIKLINNALSANNFDKATKLLKAHKVSLDGLQIPTKESANFIINYVKKYLPDFSIKKTTFIKTLSKFTDKKTVVDLFTYSKDISKPDTKVTLKSLDCYLDHKNLDNYDKDHDCLKKILINNGKNIKSNDTLSILKSHTKCEPGLNCKKITESFTSLYSSHKVLSKIMDAGAKACEKDKCNIIFTYDKHYTGKFEDKTDVITTGYYNGKSDLFMATDRNETEYLGTFIHEVTHYIMQKIYNNSANPYPALNKQGKLKSSQKEYHKIASAVENISKTVKPHNSEQEDIKSIISHLKKWYKESEYDCELVVRYPHMLASSYHEDDIDKYLKPLSDYYDSHLIFDMNDYISF